MRKPSPQTLRVLIVLRESPDPMTGYTVMKETELRSGIVYPILSRLEDRNLVSSKELQDASGKSRRVYSLTREGKSYAASCIKRISYDYAFG